MGPLIGLAALIPALLGTATQLPTILGNALSGEKDMSKPQIAPVDLPYSNDPMNTSNVSGTPARLANAFAPKPYVFGGGQHLSINPTLGNFGGFGGGSITDKLNASQDQNTASQMVQTFKSLV